MTISARHGRRAATLAAVAVIALVAVAAASSSSSPPTRATGMQMADMSNPHNLVGFSTVIVQGTVTGQVGVVDVNARRMTQFTFDVERVLHGDAPATDTVDVHTLVVAGVDGHDHTEQLTVGDQYVLALSGTADIGYVAFDDEAIMPIHGRPPQSLTRRLERGIANPTPIEQIARGDAPRGPDATP